MIAVPRCLLRPKFYVIVTLILTGLFLWNSTLKERTNIDKEESTGSPTFEWISLDNKSHLEHCRNSQQGSTLIVDELGCRCTKQERRKRRCFVCSLHHLWPSGCCDNSLPDTKRFNCSDCLPVGCCSVYEYCVSCCLDPDKKQILTVILNQLVQSENSIRLTYTSLKDQFEFCLMKCRTSSEPLKYNTMSKVNELSQATPKQHWMDICAAETLLPLSGWNQMVASISSQLASQIKPHLTKPEFRQMVLQLLGNEFVAKYLNDLPNQPIILQPNYMSLTTYQLLQTDATQWLQRQIITACKQLGIPFQIGSIDFNSSFDLQQFFDHIRSIVQENIMNECLVKGQQKAFDIEWWRSNVGIECQSDIIGDGLLKICVSSPIIFVARQSQFIGYGLPGKLRSWAWKFLLELFHYNHHVGQKSLRKLDVECRHNNLSQMFRQKVEIFRTSQPVEDSIDELISKTTKQMFHTCTALVEAASKNESLPTYCSTVLSQLNHHGYTFHYANVLLVMPLLTTLESTNDLATLVTYLSVFMDTCLPSFDHMKNIAHRVSTHLSNSETHLCTHVDELLRVGEITLLAELYSTIGDKRHYVVTIETFIHKWISTCFVEILNLKTLLFAWDQLFLSNWSYSMMEDLCVAIVKILKKSLLECSSAASIKKVLLTSPQLIGTQELSKMITS